MDPIAGAAKAAQALRPGGRLAVFWNVFQPSPDVAEAFFAVYRRIMPGLPPPRSAPGAWGSVRRVPIGMVRAPASVEHCRRADGTARRPLGLRGPHPLGPTTGKLIDSFR